MSARNKKLRKLAREIAVQVHLRALMDQDAVVRDAIWEARRERG
jgi:hypothetical protein